MKNKDSIMALCESNVLTSKQGCAAKFSDVNEALYQWYCLACSSGLQLVENCGAFRQE